MTEIKGYGTTNDINIEIEQECPICKEKYNDKFITECKHSFCKECLKKCCKFDLYDKCPMCQQFITFNDKVRLSGGTYTKAKDDLLRGEKVKNVYYWLIVVLNVLIYGTFGSFSIYFSTQKDVINQDILIVNGIFLFISMILSPSAIYYFIFDRQGGRISIVKYIVLHTVLGVFVVILMAGKCTVGWGRIANTQFLRRLL